MRNVVILYILFAFTGNSISQLKYVDAINFPLYGKATDSTITRYERLPASFEKISRKALWYQGRCSSGLYIRFNSNSKTIGAKWSVLRNKQMNHMAYTGIKGLDLYALDNGEWVHARPAIPTGKDNQAIIVKNMDGQEREYMLYLSLYDQVTQLEIGIDSTATISLPKVNRPDITKKPVVWYGTSIAMGGCASRPGTCYTSFLSRWLNREIINLGFSGNALLDPEIAQLMASKEAALYVLDFLPNVSPQMVKDKAENFYSILRKGAPKTAILFVEHPIYPFLVFDQKNNKFITDLNIEIKKVYNKLKKAGEKNIYYMPAIGLIDVDSESTVDGEHFTDLGFFRMAKTMHPKLTKILKNAQ